MRRNWRSNPLTFLLIILIFSGGLIMCSLTGLTAPVEGVIAQPVRLIAGFFNRITLSINTFTSDFGDIQALQERNAELEEQLALLQAELIDLREIASDYDRLADLVNYTGSVDDQEFLAANVIAIDQRSFLRNIIIDRGTRDGIALRMPVVTDLGLVGRVINVTANEAQVQLVTDENSTVSARLQTTRSQGSVLGRPTGNMRMTFIPLGSEIRNDDLVVTSGLGGDLPPDIVIGQVTSSRQFEFELFQEAEVRSLIDFNNLEIVMVVTNFQPIDLTVFEKDGS